MKREQVENWLIAAVTATWVGSFIVSWARSTPVEPVATIGLTAVLSWLAASKIRRRSNGVDDG